MFGVPPLNLRRMSDIERLGETRLEGVLSDPFAKEAITDIDIHYTKRSYGARDWYAWGIVGFKRNNTSGEVRFDGKTLDDVAIQIKNFIENEL
jgi:hypothetical protein